ncbi:hypothetical protein, partial [Priestia megaterium]|uniref:hypothetical protein n=1 Tax=Priestia megaterium TaxID=1404 RepID=UPI00300A056B
VYSVFSLFIFVGQDDVSKFFSYSLLIYFNEVNNFVSLEADMKSCFPLLFTTVLHYKPPLLYDGQ